MPKKRGFPAERLNKIPLAGLIACLPIISSAQDGEHGPVREFRTQDDRLEAGNRRQLGESLYLTSLAELEWERERLRSRGTESTTESDSAVVLQGGLNAVFSDQVEADFEVEYDSAERDIILDEAILAADLEPFELELGKDTLAFGEYFSRFTTGPLLEFGETTESAVTVIYNHGESLALSISGYDGRTEVSGGGSQLDYVVSGELEPRDGLTLGFGYISDLADSDARLLGDDAPSYSQKVPAVSGYALWSDSWYDATFELVSSLRRFRELDSALDRPLAWNAEVGVFVLPGLDLSFRIEGSDELADAADLRAGAALTWRFHEGAMLTVEALHGRFDRISADSAGADPTKETTIVALQVLLAL